MVVRIVTHTREELLAQRQEILDWHHTTLDDFRRRAESYRLVGEEWTAWDDLENIAFLLGE